VNLPDAGNALVTLFYVPGILVEGVSACTTWSVTLHAAHTVAGESLSGNRTVRFRTPVAPTEVTEGTPKSAIIIQRRSFCGSRDAYSRRSARKMCSSAECKSTAEERQSKREASELDPLHLGIYPNLACSAPGQRLCHTAVPAMTQPSTSHRLPGLVMLLLPMI
jgi:hypothetical protein